MLQRLIDLCRYIGVLSPVLLIVACEKPEAVAGSRLHADTRAVNVISSIKPLHLLANDLLKTVPESELTLETLIPASQSPHHYSLSFSDVKRIKRADLILWVGPELETFLEKPIREWVPRENQLRLNFAKSERAKPGVHAHSQHNQHEGYRHAESDAHMWLSYRDARQIAESLAVTLQKLLPQHDALIQSNLASLHAELGREQRLADDKLHKQKKRSFAVYHDGYSKFVQEFGLTQKLHVTTVPEQQISVKQLVSLKQAMKDVACLLVDVSDYEQASRLAKKLEVKSVAIDILAIHEADVVDPDLGHFAQYMRGIVASFSVCLAVNGG